MTNNWLLKWKWLILSSSCRYILANRLLFCFAGYSMTGLSWNIEITGASNRRHTFCLQQENMASSKEQEPGTTFSWHDAWYLTYGIVMFAILSIGFLGNALTVIILRRPQHVRKALTPLMINLSIGSLIIIVLGYPVVITLLMTGGQVSKDDPSCR